MNEHNKKNMTTIKVYNVIIVYRRLK